MRIDFYDWIQDKAKRGEEVKLTALLIDVDNSPLLVNSAKKMVSDGAYLELDDDVNIEDKQEREKIDRMFIYNVNKYALEVLLDDSRSMVSKATRAQVMSREFLKLPNVTEEQKKEVAMESAQLKQEAIENVKKVSFIKSQFEDKDNQKDFMDDGAVWFRDDKQVALDILDEIEEVKDDKVNNFVTASSLVEKIDELISRIDKTIERLDTFINAKDAEHIKENETEIEGAQPLEDKDTITPTVEEASKDTIKGEKLEDLSPAPEKEQKKDVSEDKAREAEKKETAPHQETSKEVEDSKTRLEKEQVEKEERENLEKEQEKNKEEHEDEMLDMIDTSNPSPMQP